MGAWLQNGGTILPRLEKVNGFPFLGHRLFGFVLCTLCLALCGLLNLRTLRSWTSELVCQSPDALNQLAASEAIRRLAKLEPRLCNVC
jgi:hypothetical protein